MSLANHPRSLLLSAGPEDAALLSQRVRTNLAERIATPQAGVGIEEIHDIEKLNKALFPRDFEISDEARETIRVIAGLSLCELKPARNISSHRKYIGGIIVFLKRLTWPLIRIHLKDTFEALQTFNSWVVYSQAQQVLKVELLERELKTLKCQNNTVS